MISNLTEKIKDMMYREYTTRGIHGRNILDSIASFLVGENEFFLDINIYFYNDYIVFRIRHLNSISSEVILTYDEIKTRQRKEKIYNIRRKSH